MYRFAVETTDTLFPRFRIQLAIHRQSVVPFGARAQIRDLIECEMRTLGSSEGGWR